MSESEMKPMRVCIDEKWVACQPAEDLGFLGARTLVELSGKAAETNKRLPYSYLADLAGEANQSDSLQIMTLKQFHEQRTAEDRVLD